MRKNQQNNGISAVIISVVLHLILFGLLIWGSFYSHVEIMGGGEDSGEAIGAVMVDTGKAAQEWGRLQQNKKGEIEKQRLLQQQKLEEEKRQQQLEIEQQQLEKQRIEREKQLAEQKKQEQQKKLEEQKRLAAIEKQKAEEAQAKQAAEAAKLKAEAEAQRLAMAAKQAEQEKIAKAKAEKERLEKERLEKQKIEREKAEKAKAEKERAEREKAEKEKLAKLKAEKEAKAKAEKEAKAEAEKRAAQAAALDDFLNSGDIGGGSAAVGGNANKRGSQGSGAAMGNGDGGKIGDQYAGLIKKEIMRRFLIEPSFLGKKCEVRIQLERDGTISSYRKISGDGAVCSAALSAVARTKKVPAAPTDAIYERNKSPIIVFEPK